MTPLTLEFKVKVLFSCFQGVYSQTQESKLLPQAQFGTLTIHTVLLPLLIKRKLFFKSKHLKLYLTETFTFTVIIQTYMAPLKIIHKNKIKGLK